MKKDKEWAQEQVNFYKECVGEPWNSYTRGLNVGYRTAETIISQLEEPSEIVLSEPSAWKTIARLYHPNEVYWGNVRDSYLESLDEQEKKKLYRVKVDRGPNYLYVESLQLYKDVIEPLDFYYKFSVKDHALKFTSRIQAKGVAELVGGEVEEVTE